MATFAAGYNPGSTPILIDELGHTLGGGEWGPVRAATDMVRGHVDGGRLVIHRDLPRADDLAPEATDALERAEHLTARAAALEQLDADQLGVLAAEAGVAGEGGPPSVTELRARLVFSDVDLPTPAPAPEPPPPPAPDKRAARPR